MQNKKIDSSKKVLTKAELNVRDYFFLPNLAINQPFLRGEHFRSVPRV